MLFNLFKKKTVAAPVAPHGGTMSDLVAWLETKPADETYVYGDASNCLAAQYNRSRGRPYNLATLSQDPTTFDGQMERLAAKGRPSTFGAALECARMLVESVDVV